MWQTFLNHFTSGAAAEWVVVVGDVTATCSCQHWALPRHAITRHHTHIYNDHSHIHTHTHTHTHTVYIYIHIYVYIYIGYISMLCAAEGRHDCLWPKATRLMMSYICIPPQYIIYIYIYMLTFTIYTVDNSLLPSKMKYIIFFWGPIYNLYMYKLNFL